MFNSPQYRAALKDTQAPDPQLAMHRVSNPRRLSRATSSLVESLPVSRLLGTNIAPQHKSVSKEGKDKYIIHGITEMYVSDI